MDDDRPLAQAVGVEARGERRYRREDQEQCSWRFHGATMPPPRPGVNRCGSPEKGPRRGRKFRATLGPSAQGRLRIALGVQHSSRSSATCGSLKGASLPPSRNLQSVTLPKRAALAQFPCRLARIANGMVLVAWCVHWHATCVGTILAQVMCHCRPGRHGTNGTGCGTVASS